MKLMFVLALMGSLAVGTSVATAAVDSPGNGNDGTPVGVPTFVLPQYK
jgi:hypothetical protein